MEPDRPPEAEQEPTEPTVAARKLGVQLWDRPAIYRDVAQAATEVNLPYWMVLLLSGAIATLGLALNSAAVVIGAMLIAPLLSPIMGLTVALSVGDGRLAAQMLIVILLSTLGVVAFAALLTVLLPYQTVTPEILSRTRPTTLDLAIAVFSGLAGAVVTVARRTRLSASVPGVAIAVALVPPLGVAGFGIGVGWEASLISGSLLLFGANLGGIVLSGMGLFLLVGMQRPDVVAAAREWHEAAQYRGFAAWLDLKPGVRSLGMLESPMARLGLAVVFVVLVAFPLRESLRQIVRETTIERAVGEAEAVFSEPGRSSILSRQIQLEPAPVRVYLRVATADWYGADAKAEFERRASAAAGEPVRVVLNQLAAGEDLEHLGEMVNGLGGPLDAALDPVAPPPGVAELLRFWRSRLAAALDALALPEGVHALDADARIGTRDTLVLVLTYTAPAPLSADAEAVVARQLEKQFAAPSVRAQVQYASLAPPRFPDGRPTSAELDTLARTLHRWPRLRLVFSGPPAAVDSLARHLQRRRVAPERVRTDSTARAELRASYAFGPARPRP